MPLDPRKRAFLAEHLGERATKELETTLASLTNDLGAAGLELKALDGYTGGVSIGYKTDFLEGALARVPGRLAGKAKARESGDPVAAGIIADLQSLGPRPPTAATAKAVKEIEALRDPAAPYLGDLVAGRVVRD